LRKGIYLIQPKFPPSFWGMDFCRDLSGYSANFPPLNLMTLAALTPADIPVTICDEHIEPALPQPAQEIIGITGYLLQKERVLELADRYRSQGKLVAIGGPIANLTPDECRPHCDVLFEGESEYTWPQFIADLRNGTPAEHYPEATRVEMGHSPPPRLDLVKVRRYAQGIVQTARGCPFNCEFCDITIMFGRAVRVKPVSQVMEEVRRWYEAGMLAIFFADDNFAGNRTHSRELLHELIKFNASVPYPPVYHCQISVDITGDPEFLELMRQANFHAVFVGIETPRKESLKESNKVQNLKVDLVKAVQIFQSYGLFVFAGMIVGFDNDDEGIFDEVYNFVQAAKIPLAMVGLLQALPKTALHRRLLEAGRIRQEIETGNNTRAVTNVIPLKMPYQRLCAGYINLCRKLYSYGPFRERLIGSLENFTAYTHRAHRITPATFLAGMRVILYYLFTLDFRRQIFFVRSLFDTLRVKPQALVPVMWYLGMYKHLRSFAHECL